MPSVYNKPTIITSTLSILSVQASTKRCKEMSAYVLPFIVLLLFFTAKIVTPIENDT